MMVLKSCNEDSCRHPWHQLHPGGQVNSLADALDSSYDKFYANQPKVSFSECSVGYHIWAEGPQKYNVFGGGRGGGQKGETRQADVIDGQKHSSAARTVSTFWDLFWL